MTELTGAWFDGRDSRARAVVLSRVEPSCLRLVSNDAELDLELASVRLSPRLGSTPRVLHLPGHGQVECPDSPLLEHWFGRGDRIEAAADRLERRPLIGLAAAVFTVLGVIGFLKFGLPAAATLIAPRVPARIEHMMSRQALALMDRLALEPSQLAKPRQAALREQFRSLVNALPREGDMQLLFRHAPGIGANAFALPDGKVVITDELIAMAHSDDEVMAVLAHEAGHHEHRHALRQTLESSGIVVMASLLFGDVSGSSLTVALPTVLLETGFSREHEREADDFALALLKRRHKSTQAFADILRRLSADGARKRSESTVDGEVIGYLSTHPPSRERIERAEQAARSP